MSDLPTEGFLTPQEIARYLRVSQLAIQKWCRDGKLKATRVGGLWRIRREDLDEFLTTNHDDTPAVTTRAAA